MPLIIVEEHAIRRLHRTRYAMIRSNRSFFFRQSGITRGSDF
jgi:hypothetical protein